MRLIALLALAAALLAGCVTYPNYPPLSVGSSMGAVQAAMGLPNGVTRSKGVTYWRYNGGTWFAFSNGVVVSYNNYPPQVNYAYSPVYYTPAYYYPAYSPSWVNVNVPVGWGGGCGYYGGWHGYYGGWRGGCWH